MAGSNEKLFKTMAYAIMALCQVTFFGFASQVCGVAENCNNSFVAATIAFGVIGFIISLGMLVLWFIFDEIAAKICIFVSSFLLMWIGIGVALAFQTAGILLSTTVYYLALIAALVIAVFNWNNNPYCTVKIVAESKATAPTSTVDAPPSLQQEESQA